MADATPCMTDPELWFSTKAAEQATAKALCRTCPLQAECAELGFDFEFGVWGGLTPLDRRKQFPDRWELMQARSRAWDDSLDAAIVAERAEREREAEQERAERERGEL